MAGNGKGQKAANTSDAPSLSFYPAYLRKISKPRAWKQPLDDKDLAAAAQVFQEGDEPISLWLVSDDIELRRVAIAINEGRGNFHETIDFLPVYPQELLEAGAASQQTLGNTTCRAAQPLDYDVQLDDGSRTRLCRTLLASGRKLERCKRAEMKEAERRSEAEGCFATVHTSTECACGAARTA